MKDTTTIKLGPVNVRTKQNIVSALSKITGVGNYQATKIALHFNIDLTKNLCDIDTTVVEQLDQFLSGETYTMGSYTHELGKYWRYRVKQNIKAHITMHTQVGQNQQKGYRVHGQKRK